MWARRVVGNFSYAKLPMVLDLEAATDELMQHELLCAIAGDEVARTAVRARHPNVQLNDPDHTPLANVLLTLARKAGVETDVLGIGRDGLSPEELSAVTAAHPRPDFKRRILQAFTDGNKHRPRSTFGNVNADVLAHFDPSFVRDDFVEIILNNSWPE